MRIIAIVILFAFAAAGYSATRLEMKVVDDAAWTADVAPGWERAFLSDNWRETFDRTLIVQEGTLLVVPAPLSNGCITAKEWRAFQENPRNPQRNAVRLLGPPDTVRAIPRGVVLSWRKPIVGGIAAGWVMEAGQPELTIEGNQFTWRYMKMAIPPPIM